MIWNEAVVAIPELHGGTEENHKQVATVSRLGLEPAISRTQVKNLIIRPTCSVQCKFLLL